MKYEKSCGAVVFKRVDSNIKFLIIQSIDGTWGFPKGHMELGESEIETALREIKEEVGITINFINGFRVEDEYLILKNNILKKVVYFLAEYKNQEFTYQKEELKTAVLVDYKTALSLFQFDSLKKTLEKAFVYLNNY